MRFQAKSAAAAVPLVIIVLFFARLASAQAVNSEQAKKAVERSSNAARIVEKAMNAGDQAIPKELLDKAKAVAVFPHLVKAKLLIEHLTVGFGVVSRRLPNGWSAPAYYTFGGAGIGFNIAGGETADIIMLFMNQESADWFQKGRFELKGKKAAVSGAVGTLTDEQQDKFGKANLILYAIKDGQVIKKDFNSNFFNSFDINPDNKLNKAVYGIKSSEVLRGKEPVVKSYPQDVNAFQLALARQAP